MRRKLEINGMLLLDKPLNISSNNVLQRIRYLFGAKKAGHTGALDPLASGMLPICFGETTKIANILLDGDKSYRTTAELGVSTTTSDREGEVLATRAVNLTREQIQATIDTQFTGEIMQVPTMWSAIKYQGKPLYEYARQGISVPQEARPITIKHIKIIDWQAPYLTLDITCSKGTYIRTVIDDLGEALGCGAHVAALHRNWVQGFETSKMITMDEIEALAATQDWEQLHQHLLPIDAPASHLPIVTLDNQQAFKLCQGMTVVFLDQPTVTKDALYRVYHPKHGFLGIATGYAYQRLRGYRLTSKTPEITTALKHDLGL